MDNRQHSKKAPRMTRSQKLIAALTKSKRAWQDAIGQALAPNYYQGTVPDKVKARRRAKNKVARKSRRINRQRAKR